MKIDRPLWNMGAMLSPQQFQQRDRWEAWTNDCIAHLALVHPWGVLALDIDLPALRLGQLKLTLVRLRLPDGTLIDSTATDELPAALVLDPLRVDGEGSMVIALCLPMEQASGNNCLLDGPQPERPQRYRRVWREVQDLNGHEQLDCAVLQHGLSLRRFDAAQADFVDCPLIRLVRDNDGLWSLDSSFVPPLLSLAAHPGLLLQLDNLLIQLAAKRERLMGMRRESNQRMADFAVADVSLFWLLNALNTYQPILADIKAHPARHPEPVYRELVKLAGSLLTFSLEHDIDRIPPYRHRQLEGVFQPLLHTISLLLEASLPSRVIALTLKKQGMNRWHTSLDDPRLLDPEAVDFYLSVRCRLPAAQLQQQFPGLCKAGAPDDINELINAAIGGIPLRPLSHVPAAIPLRLENQYFALDIGNAKGQAMLVAQACTFYVPSTLKELQLELFAVLRT